MSSVDEKVTTDLIETLEDGAAGFTQAADSLADENPTMAASMREYAAQRKEFSNELRSMAADYGDDIDESGSVVAKMHRGWISLKDALSGSNVGPILKAVETGEDHAVSEYEDALEADVSANLRTVIARQQPAVVSTRDAIRQLVKVSS